MNNAAVKTTPAIAGDMALAVSIRDGTVTGTFTPDTSSVGTPTRVATVIVATVIKAANAAREGLSVFNQATSNLYLILSATAPVLTLGLERFTVKLVPGAYYEVPFNYTGIVQGIWDAADAAGFAAVVEMT